MNHFKLGGDPLYDIPIIQRVIVKDLNYDLDSIDKATGIYKNGLKRIDTTLNKSLGVYFFKHKIDGVTYVGSCGGEKILAHRNIKGVVRGWSLYNRLPQHRNAGFSKNYFSATKKPFGPYLDDCKLFVLIVCDYTTYVTDKLKYRQQIRALENHLNYKYQIKASKKGVEFYSKK